MPKGESGLAFFGGALSTGATFRTVGDTKGFYGGYRNPPCPITGNISRNSHLWRCTGFGASTVQCLGFRVSGCRV